MTTVACQKCGKTGCDLRFRICFACASSAEEQAARRTVLQHFARGLRHLRDREFCFAQICFSWALERLFRRGDYKKGGTFDREGYNWRQAL